MPTNSRSAEQTPRRWSGPCLISQPIGGNRGCVVLAVYRGGDVSCRIGGSGSLR